MFVRPFLCIGDDEAIKIAEDKFHAADDENEVSKESDGKHSVMSVFVLQFL